MGLVPKGRRGQVHLLCRGFAPISSRASVLVPVTLLSQDLNNVLKSQVGNEVKGLEVMARDVLGAFAWRHLVRF